MSLSARQRWSVWALLLAGAASLQIWGDPTPGDDDSDVVAALPARSGGAVLASSDGAGNLEAGIQDGARSAGSAAARSAPSSTAALERPIPRDQLIEKRASPDGIDIFGARNWTPPPPPPPSAPIVAPMAPPLPYAVQGKKQQGGQWEVYLGQGERSVIAREGGDLDGLYEVVRIQPPLMSLRYRPLGQIQQMTIGE